MLEPHNHKGKSVVIHCAERVALGIGSDEIEALWNT
jgi:hypothetical protein